MKPYIIAHRGASALAKHENSLEAFQIAIDIGSDYAEFDIRQTKDKKLIVFHDPSYKGRPIDSITYEELNLLAAKEGLHIPLLHQVLELCANHIKLDIELKETGFEEEVIHAVTNSFSYEDFMIKSFLDDCVSNIKKLDPKIKAGLLLGVPKASKTVRLSEYFPKKRLKRCKADFVSPNKRLATLGFIFRMRCLKKDIYVWTINSEKTINKFLRRSIQGIITDRPDIAIAMKDKL